MRHWYYSARTPFLQVGAFPQTTKVVGEMTQTGGCGEMQVSEPEKLFARKMKVGNKT